MIGAGGREVGAINLAICSEDPHRSLACVNAQRYECLDPIALDIDHSHFQFLYIKYVLEFAMGAASDHTDCLQSCVCWPSDVSALLSAI